jgi:DinB superfamily
MTLTPYKATIERVGTAIRSTFAQVDEWFDRPADLRSYKPASGGWSVGEVLEHITLTSHFLLIVIRNSARKALNRAAKGAAIPARESDLEILEPIGRRGSFTWSRPEHMIPTGTPSSEQVRTTMQEQARECLDILQQLGRGEGSLHRVRMSVNQSGRLDVYQWLFFLAQHARRHLDQMQEVAAEWQRL